jgi:hypothetical protein
MVGAAVFTGACVTTLDGDDVAVADPAVLDAVTVTRSVPPASAETGV